MTNYTSPLKACCLALLFLVGWITTDSEISHATEIRPAVERQTAERFEKQRQAIIDFESTTDSEQRLAYAAFLVDGVITTPKNPLRVPAYDRAIEVYRELINSPDESIRERAIEQLAALLMRLDPEEYRPEVDALRQLLPSVTQTQIPTTETPALLSEAEQERRLRSKMADGSLDATLNLLLLLRRQNSSEVDIVRSQMLFLANVAILEGDSQVVRLARLYAATLDAEENPETLLALLRLAASGGSNQVISIINDNFDRAISKIDPGEIRVIITELLASGSDRAAEVIALDTVDNNVFGFEVSDGLWTTDLLREIDSFRANYLIAKLYYQGIHVPQDLPRAIAAMDRMQEQMPPLDEERIAIADRFSRINLSVPLAARYTLPIYLDAWNKGNRSVILKVARLIVKADRAGYYSSRDELPIAGDELIDELELVYAGGRISAGSLLAQIYRDGRLVPLDQNRAEQLYRELLSLSQDDPEQIIHFQEQIAKLMRGKLQASQQYADYYTMLAGLSEKDNLWAMREYGKLLLRGNAHVASNPEKGFSLLLKALQRGYLVAGPTVAKYALDLGDTAKLRQVSDAFSALDLRTITPENKVLLANINAILGRYERANALLSGPEMVELPTARFLKAVTGLRSNQLSEKAAYEEMKQVILSYRGDEKTLLGFIEAFSGKTDQELAYVEPVLARLEELADKGLVDAIKLAFELSQLWPSEEVLKFKKVVDWSYVLAQKGNDGFLNRIARDVDADAIGDENIQYLVDTVERALPYLPSNDALRMFIARQYTHGVYRERDLARAQDLIREAAELGNEVALYELGSNYYYGLDVEIDRRRALQIYRGLAFMGSNRGSLALARSRSKSPTNRVQESPAFAHFARAATNGSVTAMTELGRSYLARAGALGNEEKGLAWLEHAASLGSKDAMVELFFYHFVKEPTQINAEAEKWLNKLVQADVTEMIIRKAVLLRTRDKEANRDEINRLLDRGEELGNAFARRLRNIFAQEDRKAS